MQTEIYIAPYGSSQFFPVDITKNVPMPHSKSIVDLTSLQGGPGELLGGGSGTLVFPGTKNNNLVFGFIFEINLSDGAFNPIRRCAVRIYQDKLQVLDGFLKLENVNVIRDYITYECQTTDGISNFYKNMQLPSTGSPTDGNASELTDIDFSDLDHTYDMANISASWTATVGSTKDGGNGYLYPMIDYGQNDLHGWWVNQFFPAIYAKEYLDRIFTFCGFTYSSNFFNNISQPAGRIDFRRLIIPCNDALIYDLAEVVSRQSNISLTANHTFGTGTHIIPLDNVIFDPLGQWNSSTHTFTVSKTGKYIFDAEIDLTGSGGGYILIVHAGTGGGTPSSNLVPFTITSTGHVSAILPQGIYNTGDTVTVSIVVLSGPITVINSSYLYNTVVNDGISEGDTMSINSSIPTGIKMQDFFESICKKYNLHIEVDPTNYTNLVIEPYDDFYNGSLLDWTKKWDRSKQVTITPMGKLNSKNYLFTYSSDSDYWNSYYTKRYFTLDHNDIYGERQIGTQNDFATDNHKTDIIFASTPLKFYNTGIFAANTKILSTIHMGGSDSNDPVNQANVSTHTGGISQSNIRILYYGGLINGAWQHSTTIGAPNWISETQYPYAGHLDNPYNPTIDICFGIPAELFYQITAPYTNSNLFNVYYSAMMAEITDTDSKVCEMFFKLNAVDIFNFSFRSVILVDKTYYKVLEITDYDLGTPQLTKVTLLKSETHPAVSVGQHQVGGGGAVGSERLPNIGSPAGITALQQGSMIGIGGQGNIISQNAVNVFITGDNNIVYGNSKNVAIHGGSGNTIAGNNVTLINCTGLNITANDVVYIDNAIYPPPATITGAEVDSALGFTPYDSANPSGYLSAAGVAALIASDSGNATMVSGSATVTLAGITPTSVIVPIATDAGTFDGTLSVNPGGGSFTINSTNPTDNGTVEWYVIKF